MFFRPVADRRHHQGHHRRVVHKCRNHRRPKHGAQLGRSERLWPPQRPIDHSRERPGALDGRGHHKERRHGQHSLVGHPLEGFGRGEHSGCQQQHRGPDHHHVGGPLPHQQIEHRAEDHRSREQCLPVRCQPEGVHRGISAGAGKEYGASCRPGFGRDSLLEAGLPRQRQIRDCSCGDSGCQPAPRDGIFETRVSCFKSTAPCCPRSPR